MSNDRRSALSVALYFVGISLIGIVGLSDLVRGSSRPLTMAYTRGRHL